MTKALNYNTDEAANYYRIDKSESYLCSLPENEEEIKAIDIHQQINKIKKPKDAENDTFTLN